MYWQSGEYVLDLKGLCQDDISVLDQFRAKIIT